MATAELKMEELDHEAYESENAHESNDFSTGDNGTGDGDSMMEDPVVTCVAFFLHFCSTYFVLRNWKQSKPESGKWKKKLRS